MVQPNANTPFFSCKRDPNYITATNSSLRKDALYAPGFTAKSVPSLWSPIHTFQNAQIILSGKFRILSVAYVFDKQREISSTVGDRWALTPHSYAALSAVHSLFRISTHSLVPFPTASFRPYLPVTPLQLSASFLLLSCSETIILLKVCPPDAHT